MARSSEHHVHAPGGAQIHMDGLQLVDAPSGDAHLHGHEATLAAVAAAEGSFVEFENMAACDLHHQRAEALASIADHLDGVVLAGEFDPGSLDIGIAHNHNFTEGGTSDPQARKPAGERADAEIGRAYV